MKKYIVYILFLFAIKLNGQTNLEINSGVIQHQGIFLRLDSLNRPIFKDDSLLLSLFIVFNHNVNEIDKIHLMIGDTLDNENGLSTVFTVTNVNNKYYISGNGIQNRQLNYGSNLVLEVKCVSNSHFKWASLFYENSQHIVSSKKYLKVNH